MPDTGRRPLVRVSSLRVLARLARTYEEPILHTGTRFLLLTDSGTGYYYEWAPPSRRSAGPAPTVAPA